GAREEMQHARIEAAEARRRVGELLLAQPVDRPAEHAHREAAQRPDLVLDHAVAEAGADHQSGARVEPGLERRDLTRIVLAVGVELERPLITLALGVAETGLQRAPDA